MASWGGGKGLQASKWKGEDEGSMTVGGKEDEAEKRAEIERALREAKERRAALAKAKDDADAWGKGRGKGKGRKRDG